MNKILVAASLFLFASGTNEFWAQGGIGMEPPPRVYTEVERPPVWPGCETTPQEKSDPWKEEKACTLRAIQSYFDETLKIEGLDRYDPFPETMLLAFSIDESGDVFDIEILRGNHPPVEEQIRQVMVAFPRFQAAMEQEEIVRYRFQIPVQLPLKK
jgi:hypothetical protein